MDVFPSIKSFVDLGICPYGLIPECRLLSLMYNFDPFLISLIFLDLMVS